MCCRYLRERPSEIRDTLPASPYFLINYPAGDIPEDTTGKQLHPSAVKQPTHSTPEAESGYNLSSTAQAA
jgi:hypothetical protein